MISAKKAETAKERRREAMRYFVAFPARSPRATPAAGESSSDIPTSSTVGIYVTVHKVLNHNDLQENRAEESGQMRRAKIENLGL